MKVVLLASVVVILVGCGGTLPPAIEYREVPVACKEEVPERPQMPTEQLAPPVDPDRFAQAAIAEIERREGYELKLRAGLVACTRPLSN